MNYLMIGANKVKNRIVEGIRKFWSDESGMGTVEVILIIVGIGLVIVFKQQIAGIVEDIFKAIREDTRVITN